MRAYVCGEGRTADEGRAQLRSRRTRQSATYARAVGQFAFADGMRALTRRMRARAGVQVCGGGANMALILDARLCLELNGFARTEGVR